MITHNDNDNRYLHISEQGRKEFQQYAKGLAEHNNMLDYDVVYNIIVALHVYTYIYIYIYIHICICILSRNIILHHIISYHIVGADERRVRGAEPVHPGASLKRELEYVVIACSVLCVYMFVVVLSS